jgi:hypothetical protein
VRRGRSNLLSRAKNFIDNDYICNRLRS